MLTNVTSTVIARHLNISMRFENQLTSRNLWFSDYKSYLKSANAWHDTMLTLYTNTDHIKTY